MSATLLFAGCSKEISDQNDSAQGANGSAKIAVGSRLEPFTLKEQFDKPHTLGEDTKKIIFVFEKATGHLVKEYLDTKPADYLQRRKILFVADVSPMPSLIRKYVALPDLREHQYPVMLIYDEAFANSYKNKKFADKVMIVTLDKLVVKGVKFVSDAAELEKEIESES